jgi:hypothetical protein
MIWGITFLHAQRCRNLVPGYTAHIASEYSDNCRAICVEAKNVPVFRIAMHQYVFKGFSSTCFEVQAIMTAGTHLSTGMGIAAFSLFLAFVYNFLQR